MTLRTMKTEEVRQAAVSLVTRRMLTAAQLEEKLLAKGAEPEQAEEVLDWAREIGLVDDRAYARELVAYYQARGYGLHKIKAELCRRKVPRDLWEEALAEMAPADDTIDRLLQAKLQDPRDQKQVKKAADALGRRGFSWEQISEALHRFRRNWEDETGGSV